MTGTLRYLTAGESHGKALVCIVEGLPAGLTVRDSDINRDLARRQKGYGRGGRMQIESDTVQIFSGVRLGKTIGSPVTLFIENRDWLNWQDVMRTGSQGAQVKKLSPLTRPRPGHADLSGALKYKYTDLRDVVERSSARETAARVAAGALAKKFLSEFDIRIMSRVVEIGGIGIQSKAPNIQNTEIKTLLTLFNRAEKSSVRCPDKKVEKKIIDKISRAMKRGDSLGGIFEVFVTGVPAGLGSYSQWDRRLNARLAYAIMGIQAIKGVEIGLGFEMARKFGSEVMDEIFYSAQYTKVRSRALSAEGGIQKAGGFYRKTNNAGGIEGGVSNSMPIVLRAAMKPIPTLRSPLSSVDINRKKSFKAAYERSDVCAVPAASVIGEAVTAFVLADSFLEKFGGDSIEEVKRNFRGYLKQIKNF
jgi:chorismate synthase